VHFPLNTSTKDKFMATDPTSTPPDDKGETTSEPVPATASSALPDDIRESIAIGNVKSVAEQPAMLANLALANLISNVNLAQQNAVANQQAMNQLMITVVGKVVNLVANLSPMEAVAVVKMDTGNDLAEQLADIKAALAAFSPSPAPEAGDKTES
jgi:hypothetical protein